MPRVRNACIGVCLLTALSFSGCAPLGIGLKGRPSDEVIEAQGFGSPLTRAEAIALYEAWLAELEAEVAAKNLEHLGWGCRFGEYTWTRFGPAWLEIGVRKRYTLGYGLGGYATCQEYEHLGESDVPVFVLFRDGELFIGGMGDQRVVEQMGFLD